MFSYSLNDGWGLEQEDSIKRYFDNIPVDDNEPIATIAIGTDLLGIRTGANFKQIVRGMHCSKKNIILHSGYTLDEVMEICNKEKNVLKKLVKKY